MGNILFGAKYPCPQDCRESIRHNNNVSGVSITNSGITQIKRNILFNV